MNDQTLVVEVPIDLRRILQFLATELSGDDLYDFIIQLEKEFCDGDLLKRLRNHFNNEYNLMIRGEQ